MPQRDVSRWLTPRDAQQITDEAAASLAPVVTEVFKAQGYEIVAAPGPGVLRLSAQRDRSLRQRAGHSLRQEFRGQTSGTRARRRSTSTSAIRVTGTLLARVVDRSTAREIRAPGKRSRPARQ